MLTELDVAVLFLEEKMAAKKKLKIGSELEGIRVQLCRGRANGWAYLQDGIIKVNKALTLEGARGTMRHEIAHFLAFKLFGERGHGPTWQVMDRALGGNGQRLNNRERDMAADRRW